MALQKQPVAINFTQGLDTKTDPYQVRIGNFLALNNSVFTTSGRLTKRNGYKALTSLPNTNESTLTTLNDNLIATGSNLYALSTATSEWLNQGTIQPVSLSVQPMIRVSTSQSSEDFAIASNGLGCVTYIDSAVAYYVILDTTTGQQIVPRTSLGSVNTPRVFLLGRYFIVTYITSTPHLQYIAIPISTPNLPGAAVDLSTTLAGAGADYDAYVANNNLYYSWQRSGSTMGIGYLTSTLVNSSPVVINGHSGNPISVTADISASTAVVWVSWWEISSGNGFSAAFSSTLAPVLAPTQIITTTSINHITSVATNQLLTVFYEDVNAYAAPYPVPGITTDFISSLTVTQAGSVSSTSVILRSVGLASKPFISVSGTIYLIATYGETNQPTYFLIDSLGNIYMRLAYSNGGGYIATKVLPTVSMDSSSYLVPYLIKDFLTTVNKGTNNPAGTPSNAIYSQTGVNLARFNITSSNQHSSEIASALHLTGGQLWEYDSVKPVEHGFQVWPENVQVQGDPAVGGLVAGVTYFWQFTYEWTDNQGLLHRSAPSIPVTFTPATAPATFTGNRTSGSPILTSVSSFTGIQVGQAITGTGIPVPTHIVSFNVGAATITMSNNASSGTSTATTVTPTSVTSVDLYVPTDRLTYKVAPNPIRIVGYRWSSAQEVYYQFTSVAIPIINDTTIDYKTIPDTNSDAQILGNAIIYTTGGVIENIAAPASIASALFDNRLWIIDAEDRNLLWYSKQVIEDVPVEMSDLLTYYVAPTTSAQGSTGPLTAIYPMDDKLILFKKDAAYYVNGTGPDNTGSNSGYSQPIFITSSVGCANPNSIVLIPDGLMFQSDKGIWLLGRDLSTSYIGTGVEAYNASTVMSALSIPATTQVRFILPNNITLMYDYFFKQWATHSNTAAISATLYEGEHTYLNSFGQVFQENPGSFIDGSTPVLMSLTTSWINIAGLQGFERFYFGNLLGTYFTPFTLQVGLAYNYNPSLSQAITVTPNNFTPNWGGEALWGSGNEWGSDQDEGSGSPANVFSARLFPEIQKCQSFQVSIQEVYDPSFGVSPGEGLTLSGLSLIVGMKKGYRTQSAIKSFG